MFKKSIKFAALTAALSLVFYNNRVYTKITRTVPLRNGSSFAASCCRNDSHNLCIPYP